MIFKKYFLLLLLCNIFLSCSKTDDRVFEVKTELDYDIPGGLNTIETFFFPVNNVPTFWSAFLNSSTISEDEVGQVLPSFAVLESKFGLNLDFINEVSVWMYDTNFENGREIFYLDPVKLGDKTRIELFSNLSDVNDLIIHENVLIELRLTMRQIIASNTEMRLKLEFAVFKEE